MLVTIITPVYNGERYIQEVYKSLKQQTYINWEWIVVDDMSIDSSWYSILELSKCDDRIICLQNKSNLGSGKSRNIAIEMAKGSYIAFLDCDDLWYPSKLENQICFMKENNAVLSHTSYDFIDDLGNSLNKEYKVQSKIDYKGLLMRTDIGCLTAVYNADILGKRYMSHHQQKQDYYLWLSILREGHESFGLKKVLASYRVHENSATSNKYKLVFKHFKFLKETQGLNNFRALYYTLLWIYNGFVKHFLR